jgi:hypothetical protein
MLGRYSAASSADGITQKIIIVRMIDSMILFYEFISLRPAGAPGH